MRDVNYGWLLRYLHANGAAFFFAASFTPTSPAACITAPTRSRARCCGCLGVILFLLMVATGFMGYTCCPGAR